MATSLHDFCAERSEHLLAQWDRQRNGSLSPRDVSYGSHRKVWWLCGAGHSWQAEVKSRTAGKGCPICARRVLVPGENDLATTHPDIAAQWHPEHNGELKPQNVAAGAERKVWWLCAHGHTWQAWVFARTGRGDGCPVCDGKVVLPGFNDLASKLPELAEQWHPEANGTLTPEGVTAYSNRTVWWVCERGHEFRASIAARARSGSGCPYCTGRKVLTGFNDLETTHSPVAAQWHPELNGTLTPQMVTAGSHKKVWWQCADGHVWKTVVYSRTGNQQSGCPVCAGRTKEPQFGVKQPETAV